MKTLILLVHIIFILTSSFYVSAQNANLSVNQITKLNKCELLINNKKIPTGFLYKIDHQNIQLFFDIQDNAELRSIFVAQNYPIDNLTSVKVYNKKKRFLFAIIGAITIGSLSYTALYKDNSGTTTTGEEKPPNFFAGNGNAVIGGILGAGAGTSLGMVIAKKKINFRKSQAEIVEEIKKWTF